MARMVRSGRETLTGELQAGRIRDDRTYLVTGGLGGIGCVVAGWLADNGAGAIVLNGRRPPDPEAEETIAALRQRGVTVQVEVADVTDEAAVEEMLARIDATLPRLGGVIHSVGVVADGSLASQNWERFEHVMWPKILGAWRLHRATENRDLDLFILFSGLSGIRGNPGQGNHASANTVLDQLAAHRRSLGLPGQAIQWGSMGRARGGRGTASQSIGAYGGLWHRLDDAPARHPGPRADRSSGRILGRSSLHRLAANTGQSAPSHAAHRRAAAQGRGQQR